MRATLICIFAALFIVSCDSRTYMEEDFYDTVWENSDGSKATVIELHKDGTCDVKNLDWDIIYISRFKKSRRLCSPQLHGSIA